MSMHDLIFTKKWPQKLYRHTCFWIGQIAFWVYWAAGFSGAFSTIYIAEKLKYSTFFIPHIAYTYFVVYFLAPRFFEKRKYKQFVLWLLLTTVVCFIISVTMYYQLTPVRHLPREKQLLNLWFSATAFIFNGPPAICAMFITFKMLKNYFLKIQEYRLLTKENAMAELQLLNAEIQPHFLFNTLNTIYSFTLDRSDETRGLVVKLKDTIGYMVYECDSPQVSLEKEIKMIRDYAGLEKIRYGSRLHISMTVSGECEEKMIAPLLMIPFVENCFKHGVGKTIGNAWIDCSVKVTGDKLDFSISNGNGHEIAPNEKSGIGLANVKKRLELLYPGRYTLSIDHTEQAFTIYMQVPVHPGAGRTHLSREKNENYAGV